MTMNPQMFHVVDKKRFPKGIILASTLEEYAIYCKIGIIIYSVILNQAILNLSTCDVSVNDW